MNGQKFMEDAMPVELVLSSELIERGWAEIPHAAQQLAIKHARAYNEKVGQIMQGVIMTHGEACDATGNGLVLAGAAEYYNDTGAVLKAAVLDAEARDLHPASRRSFDLLKALSCGHYTGKSSIHLLHDFPTQPRRWFTYHRPNLSEESDDKVEHYVRTKGYKIYPDCAVWGTDNFSILVMNYLTHLGGTSHTYGMVQLALLELSEMLKSVPDEDVRAMLIHYSDAYRLRFELDCKASSSGYYLGAVTSDLSQSVLPYHVVTYPEDLEYEVLNYLRFMGCAI